MIVGVLMPAACSGRLSLWPLARRLGKPAPSYKGGCAVAKGQMKSNKETKKPKKEVKKTIAANPSTKGKVVDA